MRIPRNTLLLFVVLAANSVFANPIDEVRTAQAKRIEATLNHDIEALDECYSDDLVYTHSDGRVDDRDSLLAAIGSGRVDYQKMEIIAQDIRIYNAVAVITGSADFVVVVANETITMTLRFTSVYVHQDGRWQFASWHSSRVSG